jgi:peptidyl-prolyl cis-trans isomerase B (cyclophilin B)
MKRFTFLFAILLLVGVGCIGENLTTDDVTFNYPDKEDEVMMDDTQLQWEFPGELSEEEIANKQIRIQTEKGDIVFELYHDTAPLTVSNFVYLTTGGYYNGLTFHRREEGFVIQGGDPNGNGTGGPGYKFEDELDDAHTYERGIVAMANAGPNTNGSQFFIMLDDTSLPKAYSIFGRVTEGMDVVDEIIIGDVMKAVSVEDK